MSSMVIDAEISRPFFAERRANFGVIAFVVLGLASVVTTVTCPSVTADGPEQLSPYVTTLAAR